MKFLNLIRSLFFSFEAGIGSNRLELTIGSRPKLDISKAVEAAQESFRFRYIGGGYFRDKNVPKDSKADVLHGSEVIEHFCAEIKKQLNS
jgi:hypothetical protein